MKIFAPSFLPLPGAAVPQGEGPGADGALVRLGSGVRLPVTSGTKKIGRELGVTSGFRG